MLSNVNNSVLNIYNILGFFFTFIFKGSVIFLKSKKIIFYFLVTEATFQIKS
jgi:hypothetical protein